MTGINNEISVVNFRKRPGAKRMVKQQLKIDMTPMTDLGFLLISFFVITTELSRPMALKLYMPADGDYTPSAASKTITFLAGANDHLFYYYGEEKEAGIKNPIIPAEWNDKTGIGRVISEKQLQLEARGINRNELTVIIKPGKEATYKNTVDLLDEMLIHRVTRYAVVKATRKEQLFLEGN